MSPSPRQLAREQRSHGPGPACFYRWLLRVEQTINQAADSVFLIGGQDNKWLRELMQRSVKPGNKLLVLKTNPRNIKKPRACDPRLYRLNSPPLPIFSKAQSAGHTLSLRPSLTIAEHRLMWRQSRVCDLRAHSANLNSFNRVSESYCRGFCIKQVLRYQVLEEIHRNGN